MGVGIRNSDEFWRTWSKQFGHTLSQENLQRIEYGLSPIVDGVWIETMLDHADYVGDVLVHHHLNYGSHAIPIPDTIHRFRPGKVVYHPPLMQKRPL